MFNHIEIEKKWQKYWDENKTFKTDEWDFSKPKFYALDMFPYPSGKGLHVGHVEGYTASDIVSRMKRMQGYNVLHPMGFDSFGLPAEQFAIKTGNHPAKFTNENIETYTKQLKLLGFSYDWEKKISTCEPDYYKWTQWIFKRLYDDKLARYVDMPVNWCEELGTVLANDEIIDGKSERGGYPVIRKNMKQWVLDIQKYADRLLDGLNELDWPESTKEIQRNWIGRSVGAHVKFKVDSSDKEFTVFTTRCDTLFGATYCVLAPEHEIVDFITTPEMKETVEEYKKACLGKSELERTELTKEKTGVFTGAYAINPVNNKKVPIWISDYVLASYGTGAIMAVPAHDQRDYEFAKKFNLDIIPVIEGGNVESEAYVGDGVHINSDFLDGLNKQDAIDKIIDWLVENKVGSKKVNYKIREWIFARQRYWGEPLPIIHMDDGTDVAIEDSKLPLVLPELLDYKPVNGASPLNNAQDWVNVVVDGKKGKRETNTMPGSAASSWYFLRYIDPKNNDEIANKDLMKYWLPVDLYLGGVEHATGHLLYSRFWNNYLYDKKIVPVKEPFKKLCHQGMILGSNGEKMSKSKGNVVNPDDVVKAAGADTLRLCEMFMGPLEDAKPWNENGIDGARKFLDRVYRLIVEDDKVKDTENENLERVYNQTIKKVTSDYEALKFNTAISQMMIFVNSAYKEEVLPKKMAEGLIKMLNPICPHITEEMWQILGHDDTIAYEKWPVFDKTKIDIDTVEIPVQVNGKVKTKIIIEKNDSKEVVMKKAKESLIDELGELNIVKEIYVPQKIVNVVVK